MRTGDVLLSSDTVGFVGYKYLDEVIVVYGCFTLTLPRYRHI